MVRWNLIDHLVQFCHFTDEETETHKCGASCSKPHKTALCLPGTQPDSIYRNVCWDINYIEPIVWYVL